VRLSINQRAALKILGLAALLGTAVIAPNALILFKPKSSKEKYKYKRIIQKLFDDKVIYLSGEKIELTERGKQMLARIQADEVVINCGDASKWDGVWHLVCYDIPEEFKQSRDALRKKLSDTGFMQIQLSLWVFPYNCKEEIALIAQHFGVAPFVAYLNTNHLPQQSKLEKYYGLHK